MRPRALPLTRLGSPRQDTLILCYHAVSDTWPADLSVTPAAFEGQIRARLERGYRGVTLTQSQMPSRPAKALVVSFDDAYLSTLTEAAPILARLGVPGTLFVPTDYMGQPEPMTWPGIEQWAAGPHRKELAPLSWAQVRSLAEDGWEIGSHTCSHPHLTTLADADLERELGESRSKLESELGAGCDAIAYPYGDVDARVAGAARATGYRLGVGLPARWTGDEDAMQLPRVGVYNGQGGPKLALKLSPLARRLRLLLGR
jgi:peptidoglycan/xylan/chitin deacetylase (PgdA/CDA1 family)